MRVGRIFLILNIFLAGCGVAHQSKLSGVEVHKGAPVVYVHPMGGDYSRASVGVLPFQVPANMSEGQGLSVAALFKDIFLGKRAFQTVRQLGTDYGDLGDASRLGREAGVDLVLAGRVNYIIEGTELGGARVDVSVRLLNVNTGNTIWYVEQTMDQPMDYPEVDLLSRLQNSLSTPPVRRAATGPTVPNMLARVAVDMADVFGGAPSVRQ